MFRRKIYSKLLDWKATSAGRSAILIEGARRVGKSTVAEEFAKNEYEDYLLIDFSIASGDLKSLFLEYMGDLTAFFRNLELITGKHLPRGKSLIIFDEVQMFPPARQAIKHLVRDGRYHYLETGSLISIKKNVQTILIPSEERRVKMYPMDFEEFLWACGDNVTADILRECFEKKSRLGDAAHRKVMGKFRTYLAVGGMPQAVSLFVDGCSYREIDEVKCDILDLYEDDLRKYDTEDKDKASVVFRTIPEQLSNHNSVFRFSLVEKGARFSKFANAVSFIGDSMIGNICRNVTDPCVTPDLAADSSNFKLYLGDTGLLVSQIMRTDPDSKNDLYRRLIFGKLGINEGVIIENVVAQMLAAKGISLFFHEFSFKKDESSREKKYEIDFLLSLNGRGSPVEVKSSSYKDHHSFDLFSEKYKSLKVREKYIIYTKDLDMKDGITFLPIYMTMFL